MDLRDVVIFVQVVEQGNFSSAARSLSLKPSTVSKAITRLERSLGRRLFDRSSRTVKPTPEGLRFLEPAARLVRTAEAAQAVVASEEPRGTLRIRAMPTFAKHQLAPIMPGFLQLYPQLDLVFLLSNDRLAPLSDGADIAILSGELPSSSLVTRTVAASRWIICASPAYIARHGKPNSSADLRHHQCLNFAMETPWNQWSEHEAGHRHIAANNGDMLLALARSGSGIARLAEFHISADLRAGRLVELLPYAAAPAEPIQLLYRDKRHLSPRIRVFVDYLSDALADAPWSTRRP